MDDLLSKLLSFPPHPPPPDPISDQHYDEGIKAQIDALKKISEHKLLLHTSGGESALDVINPALNTVPYIFILLAHISAMQKGNKGVDLDKIWDKIANFLEVFDARQIRYLGPELSLVIEATISIAKRNRQPLLAISPIRDTLLRLDPPGSILTSIHVTLVKLAVASREYEAVVPVLEKYILYLPGTSNQPKTKYICEVGLPARAYITTNSGLTAKLRYQDVLEYFFYSGMVFIGLRKWESALEYLENVVTYPTKEAAVSKIMVEAYKKWILLCLLIDGKPRSLPKSINNNIAKTYHIVAKPYETLAQLFETASAARLKAEVDIGTQLWQNDCNTGLVLHILAAYQKFQIRNLANVYSKISIPEIVNLTMSAETGNRLPSPQAAETLIRTMIAEGSLIGTLSNSPNQPAVLTFAPGGATLNEAVMQKEIRSSAARIYALNQEIKQTDRLLTHDKEYIKHVQKQKKNAKNNLADQGIGGADMDWNAIEDEDIMGGVF